MFLAVKPHILPGVLSECGARVDVDRHLFVSVAAGVSSGFIEDALRKSAKNAGGIAPGRPGPGAAPGGESKVFSQKVSQTRSSNETEQDKNVPRVVRVMPNTPCVVGEAASAACAGSAASEEDVRFVMRLMQSTGLCARVANESLMDAVTGVSGLTAGSPGTECPGSWILGSRDDGFSGGSPSYGIAALTFDVSGLGLSTTSWSPRSSNSFLDVNPYVLDGTTYLAHKTGAPIIPIGIGGTEAAMASGSKGIRRVRCSVVVVAI